MMKPALPVIALLLSFICGHSQDTDSLKIKAGCLVCRYIDCSRLGPEDSKEITPGGIRSFRDLFARDAYLLWDLYKSPGDTIVPPLSPAEYVWLAERIYEGKQPVFSYPKARVKINGKSSATAFLTKVNEVVGPGESLLRKNKVKLRMELDLDGEKPLIRNIFRDTRQPVFRSFTAEAGFLPWSNVNRSLEHNPTVELWPGESYGSVSIRASTAWQAGGMAELRLSRGFREGLIFCTGIRTSRQQITSTVEDYVYTPKVMRTGDQLQADTIYMVRSPEVYEDIRLTRIEIPLLLKSYLEPWMWLKAGTVLGYAIASSDVQYTLYHYDSTGTTPPESRDYPLDDFVRQPYLSLQLSCGFEKQVRELLFGVEPALSFGMNPLPVKNLQGNYRLDDPSAFHSILETVEMPAFEVTFGCRFYIGFLIRQ